MRKIQPPFSSLSDIEVFAVESHTAQMLVRCDAATVHTRLIGEPSNHEIATPSIGGVAVVEVHGLRPETEHTFEFTSDRGHSLGQVSLTTRHSLGEIRTRFATISDIHLGLERFGVGHKLTDDGDTPYTFRCARAAIDEALAWGAELLIVKGDLTDTGGTSEWDLAERLFDGIDVPILFTPGNHDVSPKQELSPKAGSASLGLAHAPVQINNLSGVRIVVADTSRDHRGTGDLARVGAEVLESVKDAGPVFLAFHHNIQRTPVPWFWPAGISSSNARPVVEELAATNPQTFISSGHTHRNRLHWLGPARAIPYTEVSATSDYPGVWAGYEVSNLGIRQTVRRISEPSALAWTERTRRVLGTVWPRWSQGRLHDRSVDLDLR